MTAILQSTIMTGDSPHSTGDREPRFVLWIDGVGGYLVCTGRRVSFGGPAANDGAETADVPLLAGLSRRHASFVRTGEGWLIEAHGQAKVEGRPVHERTNLNDGYAIELGGSVRLRFRQPTVLSPTAAIEFESSHRPDRTVDAVILMDDLCLLGPGRENHIECPGWDRSAVVYRRGGGFFCRSEGELFIDGRQFSREAAFEPGQVVSGLDFRFRLEGVDGRR
ncbi:MAG: hypothetical protein KY476_15860 [Planctomycetes bacterium]|nr:hypothetical protein [Planctomycetota bacterium]